MKPPIHYSPDLETIPDDEADTIEGLKATLLDIMETTSEDYGHAVRSVHAKSHGILKAELTVLPDLPPEFAQGMFAVPGVYQAVLRISTNPGDILSDSISVPRGLALKVMGVEGARLSGAEGNSQDFVMVNGPVFTSPNAKAFLKSLKLLAKTTDRAEWAKKALSAVLRGNERVLEAVGGGSATLQTMGGAPNVHPLGETYYSQTAFRHGHHVAKFSLVPVSETLTRHTEEIIDTKGRPDALREAVAVAAEAGVCEWELRVQLCRDAEAMPVENPSVLWDEEDSPFITVARLHANPQPGWSEARAQIVDEKLRFSVWTGLEAHRPLGSVNRVRRETYKMSSDFRSQFNGCPIHEPQTLDLPG
jgi:hypothetical protein